MTDSTISRDGGCAMSIVVFGYRNEATIIRAVRSLVEQDSDDRFEVIVATSGGDRTAALVRSTFPDVSVIESPTRLLPGGVRNLGAALATGEIVTFLEADCVACPGWVRTRIALHREGHEAVASALNVMASDTRVAKAALYLVHAGRLAGHASGVAEDYQAYGLSFTQSLFERAGPFDEMLRSYEDTVMAQRLESLGVEVWFDPSVCIVHDGPATLTEMLHDQFIRAQRDSWVESLRLPAGRHRHRWELVPGVGAAFVFVRALYRLARRIRFTADAVRAGHNGPRHELPGLVVPMVLGQVAYQLGWITDQLRNTKRGHKTTSRDQLPVPSGVRRWVATTGDRVVALTFDGLPPPSKTARVLDVLRSAGVSAAFFVTGMESRDRSDDLRAIVDGGHIVGSRGWSGAPFPSLSDSALEDELVQSRALLEGLIGQPVRRVRPPAGAYDGRVVSILDARGLETWLWTTHPAPAPAQRSADAVVQQVMDDLTPGSIVVLDPTDPPQAEATVAALPAIIEKARRRDYELVDLDYLPPTSTEPVR
jgi:peptidoglycan/xylan/chitin deacetylase (PgdA/CDA1 family)/GT2 family glycosyltransferase